MELSIFTQWVVSRTFYDLLLKGMRRFYKFINILSFMEWILPVPTAPTILLSWNGSFVVCHFPFEGEKSLVSDYSIAAIFTNITNSFINITNSFINITNSISNITNYTN